MTNIDQRAGGRSEEALEQLLSHASPRPMPSESDVAAVREAVSGEWQAMSGRRRSRRRIGVFAIAATVLIAVSSMFSLYRQPSVYAVQVATIEKSFGSIYLLGESSELRETEALSSVLAGQTIVTGDEAGMALAWGNGGSLRMDASTRIRFIESTSVFLDSGRVYFDSSPSGPMAGISGGGAPEFVVVTDYGEVTHIGTQFMTRVTDDDLVVSVREGKVEVEGLYQDYVASSGEQVTMSGRSQPAVLSISRSGEAWDWVSRTSPVTDVDGKSLHEFLLWACRETGLEFHYEGDAEQIARHEAFLKGAIYTEPLQALKLRLETAGLEWAIVDGAIYVSDKAINVRDK
jgi:ferric-dicitrate binding protein FerR (iron transport regulator)